MVLSGSSAHLVSSMRRYLSSRSSSAVPAAFFCLVAMLWLALSAEPAFAVHHHALAAHASLHAGHARLRPAHASRRRREHHVHPHTARALKHARRHGTAAVQRAAREETQRVVSGEETSDSSETASLGMTERPLAPMNLPPLRGSHESLVRQNTRAEQDGLLRVKDDGDLDTLRRTGSLVLLPQNAAIHVDGRLPSNRRYCRSWTVKFLADMARQHYERFHRPLQVNSAVRTIEYQRHLLHINGNAAPAEGDVASPHLTGAAVDIAKKGLSSAEVAWMRAYLLPLEQAGKLDVEEEFHQSCFHISVYRSYLGGTGEVAGAKPAALLPAGSR